MGWLVIEDNNWYLLTNQLMEFVKEIRVKRKK